MRVNNIMYKQLIKTLRKNMTQPEQILWHFLRNRRFLNYKFRRQGLIDKKYIVDFICYEKNLIVELDGRQHLSQEHILYDKERTEYLNKAGFNVVRYYNTDIFNNIESVLEHLKTELEKTPSSAFLAPSPVKGEGCNKTSLRKWAKEERKKYCCDAVLIDKLKQTDQYKQAKHIMIFYPLKDEVNLLPLLNDSTKHFYLPKIEGENLLCCPFDGKTELCVSCFNTKEPVSEPIEFCPDIVIVPALAVDKNNYRLGYGGGFYDRFLGVNKLAGRSDIQAGKTVEKGINTFKIVCIPKELVVDTIYPEPFDIPMDLIITD